ncbi:MAG: ATP-dependent Clp protease adaptor ClpS [Verrucomicrobiota bacterium]|nr:ATP-dependent Clp protease adaptor ClpS [Verrucomicrobiota bacterium]
MSPNTTPEIIELTESEAELSQQWKVIVLNDPVNLMNYVVMVFRKVFGYGEQKATKHMKEVHELGKSILWTGEREQAESYVYQLQRWRLQSVLEKND